jgi:hypothetical protein
MDTQMIDSTHIKAHRSAAGGKGPTVTGTRATVSRVEEGLYEI